MDLISVIAVCICAVLLSIVLKQYKPEYAFLLSLTTGVIVLIVIVSKLTVVIDAFYSVTARADTELLHLDVILKIIALGLIAEFAVKLCNDAGESAIAGQIELSAKVIILGLAVPLIIMVLDTVLELVPK